VARTFIAFDPQSGRREVIVEVRPDLETASGADIEALERRLYERGIHSGLLITPSTAYFVRDTLGTLAFSASSYEVRELPTEVFFSRTHGGEVEGGEALYAQVKVWLDAVSGAWSTFLPDEALPFMLPEMVGRLAQSKVEEWDDVLD
jgi:hypothetical protein